MKETKFYNLVEFLEKGDRELAERLTRGVWGSWCYEEGTDLASQLPYRVLNHTTSYQIDLTTAKTPADRANWLWHLHGKRWVTADDIYNLMTAFADLFREGAPDHL
jgi:hypothetical protein